MLDANVSVSLVDSEDTLWQEMAALNLSLGRILSLIP